MVNVLKDVLKEIIKSDNKYNHHLYITFLTNSDNAILPKWLKKKYPNEMTIIIQHEYWNLRIFQKKFEILLSFNDIKVNLSIPFKSIISFADPYANFGLTLINNDKLEKTSKKKRNYNRKKIRGKNNVIDFTKFKKLN